MGKKIKKTKNNISTNEINNGTEADKGIPSLIGGKVKLDDLNKSFSNKDLEKSSNNNLINGNTESGLISQGASSDNGNVGNLNSDINDNTDKSTFVDNGTINNSDTTPLIEKPSNNGENTFSETKNVINTDDTNSINNISNTLDQNIQNDNKRTGFFTIQNGLDNNTSSNQGDQSFEINNTGTNNISQGDIALDNLSNSINNESMNTINVNSEKFKRTEDTSLKDSKEENTNENVDKQQTENNIDNSGHGNLDDFNLEKIQIDDGAQKSSNLFDLSGGSLYDSKKNDHVKTGKITVISVLISILSIIIAVFCFFYNRFITTDISNPEENSTYTFVETIKDFIGKYTNTNTDIIESINLNSTNGKAELDNLINSDLNYIQKKKILTTSVSNLSNNIVGKYGKLNGIRTDITQYGFFPKTLTSIISEDEPISSIQSSLIVLEAIKFSSAISVFSYLDTFISSLVQSLGIDKDSIKEYIKTITNRGETDINVYIKDCYLNPYESDYDCNYIGDFDEYYNNLKDNFNTKFFKELIKYTDARLEQSQIPSFSISFKEFNQNSKEITFDIEINTLKEDEAELTKKGILSPHIFIFKSLINSLRQSRFIVGDDISIKSLDVTPSTYIIGASEVNVNKSSNSFTVHIKKENAVEIDDFVYMDY